MRWTPYISLILICLVALPGYTQKIPFENFTIQNGLPQNTVNDILQDSHGYMWFATQVGVSRYDGKNFINFNISDGLSDNWVTCLTEDREGDIWMGTDGGGITVYDGQEFRIYNTEDGLMDNNIKSLLEDNEGKIWATSDFGLSIISADTIVTLNSKSGLVHNNVMCVYHDTRSRTWVGTQRGISRIKGDIIVNYTTSNGLTDNTIRSIVEDKSGDIWIATEGGGINIYDGKGFRRFTIDGANSPGIFLSLFVDSSGDVWAGSYNGGIYRYDGKQTHNYSAGELSDIIPMEFVEDRHGDVWCRTSASGVIRFSKTGHRFYSIFNGLVDRFINSIYVDSEGNVWIGSVDGLSKFGKVIFEVYNTEFGLPHDRVSAVAVGPDVIWVGTQEGLVGYDGTIFRSYKNENVFNVSNGNINPEVLSLMATKEGELWIGTYNGLIHKKGREFINYERESVFRENGVYDIREAEDGTIWAATGEGLIRWDGKEYTKITSEDGLISDFIYALELDGLKVWAATDKGLSIYYPATGMMENYTTLNGLPNNNCNDITRDGRGVLWVGTDGGLCRFTPSENGGYQIDLITEENGLTSNQIYLVAVDVQKNLLWIGHEKGLNAISRNDLSVSTYGFREGFTPLETNLGAVSIDRNGNLWFGTVGGLVKYDPSRDIQNEMPPKTYISNIVLPGRNDKIASYADSISKISNIPIGVVLPYNRNTLKFDFIGISLQTPEKVRYRYYLEGFDDHWSEPNTETSVTYKKIPHGKYNFMVLARNNDGVWNEEPVSFLFEVRPPFWKTKWFITLEVLAGLVLIFLFIKAREQRLIREKKILEEKVRVRTAEIRRQKEEIEVQKDEIEAQRDEIEAQRDLATEQRDMIMQQKQEITDSIQYAKRIQTAILPGETYVRGLMVDHFIFFKPRDIVSGDFYWFSRKGQKLVAVAADCTGHGVPGAFMSILGVNMLDEIVNNEGILTANIILNELRENVKRSLSQTGKMDEAKDGMDLALCVIDEKNHYLQYAGAYNPLIIVRDGQIFETKGDKMPIGIQVNEKDSFTNHQVSLKEGDMIYIFSDGYPDQFGGPKGGKFKIKPFKRLLQDISALSTEEQKAKLGETLTSWQGEEEQIDDILVIGIRIR